MELIFHKRSKEFNAIKRGEITHEYVPLNTKMAKKIDAFCEAHERQIAWFANGCPSDLEDERWQIVNC